MPKATLYLMVGYPGAGKTTTSRLIHDLTGAVHLWADHERLKLFKNPSHSHQENLQLYELLNKQTAELLRQGKSVIFDTNFNFLKDRRHLRQIAAAYDAQTVVIWLTTDKSLARERSTAHPGGADTRVLGNMKPEDFERISGNQEAPEPSENPIKVDGQNLTLDKLRQTLAEAGVDIN